MRRFLAAFLLIAFYAIAFAQQSLSNDSVIKMVKAGLDENTIATMIQSQPGQYDLSADALVALKQDGVSDKLLGAMAAKNAEPSSPSSAPPATAAVNPYEDLDVGVYHDVKGTWTLVATEQVNWKTGGVLKSLATDGIVKGDVNGRLKGAESTTKLNTPLEFLIKTPDGVEATDFQLVHMHQKNDAREFRTVTGGVFHASGGSARDSVAFEQSRIAKHTYKITLPTDLQPGEYAFLAPGLTGSSASGSTGKAYTFHLVE
jgi:hypothetical protein